MCFVADPHPLSSFDKLNLPYWLWQSMWSSYDGGWNIRSKEWIPISSVNLSNFPVFYFVSGMQLCWFLFFCFLFFFTSLEKSDICANGGVHCECLRQYILGGCGEGVWGKVCDCDVYASLATIYEITLKSRVKVFRRFSEVERNNHRTLAFPFIISCRSPLWVSELESRT